MKNILSSILLILIICAIAYFGYREYKSYKSETDTINTELSDLKEKYVVMVQTDAKKDIVIDSLTKLISRSKIDISKEREERYRLKLEMEAELESMIESTDEENVEYFIGATYQDYTVQKHNDFYLVNIESIKFANNAMVNIDYLEDENLSFINEIQVFNEMMANYDLKIKQYDCKIINLNKMLGNKDAQIANMNIRYALQNSRIKNLKLTKNITLAALTAIVIFKK